MANGDIIADNEEVVRHCTSSRVVDGVAQSSAFMLRPAEAHLSVNWIRESSTALDRLGQCRNIRDAMTASGRTIRPNDHFAVLKIAAISAIKELAGTAMAFTAIHEPLPTNPGHSGIAGLPEVDTPLAALAATALAAAVAEAPLRNGDL